MSRRRVLFWFKKKQTGAVPAQPAAPIPSNETGNGVTLSWALVPAARLYTIERDTHADFSTGAVVFQSVSDLTFDDTGLAVSTLYYYRLIVNNKYGESEPSDVTVITLDAVTPPATPTVAPAEGSHTINTITMTWASIPLATGYELHRATSSGGVYTKVFDGNALTYTSTGLSGATTYYFKYLAKNADGSSGFSPIGNATTDGTATVPATPGQPSAANISSSSVLISWSAVAGATDYELQRRQTAPTTTSFATIYGPGAATSFQVTGLSASSTYEFKVRASNSAGASAYSVVRIITTGNVGNTNVQPWSGLFIRQHIGVDDHPNFNQDTSVYRVSGAPERFDRLEAAGLGFLRGGWGTVPQQYVPLFRQRNMKWMIGVTNEGGSTPTSNTIAETRGNVREVRETAADICLGIEGINEPNQNRGGGAVPSNWADICANHQQAIWEEMKWNLTSVNGPIGSSPTAGAVLNPLRNCIVAGPALHDVATENSYTQANPSGGKFHWQQLKDQGILNWQTHANIHSYAGGDVPLGVGYTNANPSSGKMQQNRLKYMYQDYGAGYPFLVSEWGWHNALATTAGHEPISEAGAGTYIARGILQIIAQAEPNGNSLSNPYLSAFEVMDDFDPGAKDTHEANFGWIGYTGSSNAEAINPANWRNKPILTKAGQFLNRLRDPVGTQAYTPNRVFCTVTGNDTALQWAVTATKAQSNAGTATCWVWRDRPIWNRSTRTAIAVSAIAVTVTDRVGSRTFQVDAEVTGVDLR